MGHEVKVKYQESDPEAILVSVVGAPGVDPQEKRFEFQRAKAIVERFKEKAGEIRSGEYVCRVSEWPPRNKTEWEIVSQPPESAPAKPKPAPIPQVQPEKSQEKKPLPSKKGKGKKGLPPEKGKLPPSQHNAKKALPPPQENPAPGNWRPVVEGDPLRSKPKQAQVGDERAKAPYNFVSQPASPIADDEEPPGHEIWQEGRLSGTIRCELENLTPFYTRDGRGQKERSGQGEPAQNAPAYPDFFHLDGEKNAVALPPRSIKGMVRAAMEVLSLAPLRPGEDFDSVRYAWRDINNKKEYMEKVKSDSNQSLSGILDEEEGYLVIRPCSWALVSQNKLAEKFPEWHDFLSGEQNNSSKKKLFPVRKVRFVLEANPRNGVPRVASIFRDGAPGIPPGTQEGWLFAAGHMPTKRNAFVFYDENQDPASAIPVDEEKRERYRELRTDFMLDLPYKGELAAGEPVFYTTFRTKDGQVKLDWLGRAMLFRIPYLKETGKYAIFCNERHTMPDKILGFVCQPSGEGEEGQAAPESEGKSYCGRVAFGPGVLKSPERPDFLVEDGQALKPHILSTPNPTTFQHYLVQQENHLGGGPGNRANYNRSPLVETVLRGRKRYWHRKFGDETQNYGAVEERDTPLDTQHTHIRPLKSGHKFGFDVRFENLAPEELGLLALALLLDFETRQNANSRYAHKFGMGKPLGLGSAEVRILGIELIDRGRRYLDPIGDISSRDQLRDWRAKLKEWQNAFRRDILAKVAQDEEALRGWPGRSAFADIAGLSDAEAAWLYEKGIATIAEFARMCDFGNAPQNGDTRYMEIEPGNGEENEFKQRKVLPSPLDM